MKYLLAAIICGFPGLIAFALLSSFNFWIAGIVGAGIVGFGLDVCFRGSDRNIEEGM